MRNLFSIFFVINLLCLSPSFLSAQTYTKYLTDFPTISHKNKIELFLPDEKPTKRSIKIVVFEVQSSIGSTYWDLLQALKKRAQVLGVDAVVLQKGQLPEKFDKEYDLFLLTYSLRAVGIKYIENINYLDKIYKTKTIYEYNAHKGIYTPSYESYFKINGIVLDSSKGNAKLVTYLKSMSTQHLLYEKSRHWTESKEYQIGYTRYFDGNKKKVWKQQKWIDAYQKYKVSKIFVKFLGIIKPTTIDITYDEKEREKERIITHPKWIERERYFYNSNDKLWKIEVSRKYEGKEEIPFFKIEYAFFKNGELDKDIKKLEQKYKLR